jgi:hypothetical protein
MTTTTALFFENNITKQRTSLVLKLKLAFSAN